jgi:hypothetical protein
MQRHHIIKKRKQRSILHASPQRDLVIAESETCTTTQHVGDHTASHGTHTVHQVISYTIDLNACVQQIERLASPTSTTPSNNIPRIPSSSYARKATLNLFRPSVCIVFQAQSVLFGPKLHFRASFDQNEVDDNVKKTKEEDLARTRTGGLSQSTAVADPKRES